MPTVPFLTKIGLNDEEIKVYLALLALGPLTIGEISKYTSIRPITKVKPILDKLYGKNYAYKVEGLVDKTIGLYPFREIAAEAENDAKLIDQLIVELKGHITNTLKHLDQVMTNAEQFVHAEKKKGSDKVTATCAENRKAIETNVTQANTSITTSVDATKKTILANTDAFLKHQTDTINNFETKTITNVDAFATNLKTAVDSSLKALSTEIKGKNDSFLSDGTVELNNSNKAISERTDKLSTTLKADSKTKLEGMQTNILNGLETFVGESEGNINTLNEGLIASANEQAVSIKKIAEGAKKHRIDLNNQFKAGVGESFVKVKNDISKDLDGFMHKFNDKLEKIAEKFKAQIDELSVATAKDVSLMIGEANTSIDILAKKHNEEIATNIDLDNKAIQDGTETMVVKVNEQNSKALKAIDTAIHSLHSSVTLLKANHSAEINTSVGNTIKTMHATIETTTQETKDEYNTTKTNVITKLDVLTTGNSNAAAEIGTEKATEIKGSTDNLVTNTKQKLDETKTALLTETKKTKQKVADDANNSVNAIGTTANTVTNEVANHAKTSIRNSEETTIKAIETITQIVEESIRKEISATKGSLNEYGKRFATDAAKISKLLMEFRAHHEDLLNTVVTHPKPRIETAILYSKEAIFERLNEILTERIKSNITMVIPDPTDIPTKIIAKVKPQAKITIISKIDEIANKAIIDQIKAEDALQRIKIRKIGMQDMIGYSEYIAFDIDGGEEMLIAFKDDTEKDWIGVVSLSDGFKNVVIGETLGRQALSISRELK